MSISSVTNRLSSQFSPADLNGRLDPLSDPCSICWESLPANGEPNLSITTHCLHAFHTTCIIPSLQAQQNQLLAPTCPLCRQAIQADLPPPAHLQHFAENAWPRDTPFTHIVGLWARSYLQPLPPSFNPQVLIALLNRGEVTGRVHENPIRNVLVLGRLLEGSLGLEQIIRDLLRTGTLLEDITQELYLMPQICYIIRTPTEISIFQPFQWSLIEATEMLVRTAATAGSIASIIAVGLHLFTSPDNEPASYLDGIATAALMAFYGSRAIVDASSIPTNVVHVQAVRLLDRSRRMFPMFWN